MATADTRAAFAECAARDGVVLGPATFDWLCEQGHVGLERVAQARRDPAIVAPVIAAPGVLRERAYHDALRDLATAAMGHPPLIRIAAADGEGAAAYARHRETLAALA